MWSTVLSERIPTQPLPPPRLERDRVTVALYASFTAWGWFLYSFSPAVPLIATEQGISRAQAGLHGTALAAGTLLCEHAEPVASEELRIHPVRHLGTDDGDLSP